MNFDDESFAAQIALISLLAVLKPRGSGRIVEVNDRVLEGRHSLHMTNMSHLKIVTDFNQTGAPTIVTLKGYAQGCEIRPGAKFGALTSIELDCYENDQFFLAGEFHGNDEWELEVTEPPEGFLNLIHLSVKNVALLMHTPGPPPWDTEFLLTGTLSATFNPISQQLLLTPEPDQPLAVTNFDGTGTDTPRPPVDRALINDTDVAMLHGYFSVTADGGGTVNLTSSRTAG